MISKQVILGLVLLLGGSVTIFAVLQNSKPIKPNADEVIQAVQMDDAVTRPVAVPLTADAATEEKILSQKQKQRELYNQQLAKEADVLLSEQERARMLALEKAKQEANPTTQSQISADNASKSEMIAMPAVQTRPEAVEAARVAEQKRMAEQKRAAEQKAIQDQQLAERKSREMTKQQPNQTKQDKQAEKITTQTKTESKPATSNDAMKKGKHTVAKGDTLIGLSRTYGVPVSALAAANDMNRHDALVLGRTIVIPSASSIAKSERSAKPAQPATESTASKTKSDNKANNTAVAYNYSVQVAISPDKAKVDEVVKKYRAAGYQVSTSQTSRGIRVLIGSADSYDEANAIRQKLAKDSRVDASGAWVKKLEK
ncbi:SPOR domain-containing protein [Moraxella sp. Tifton1]|uniref:SPOR and LysM peptidoglycan-binding domain-containing protein n=1 Tax=Moraxella oculi TaxID=2940516 RepID=UPI002012DFFE|nr:LysM peptidoglycan-binding domain-containing protein [Moraxella sp. Tifton1]MCL1622927.1 SPOR domain-containing protein [Moraxella sp. Tifton1]